MSLSVHPIADEALGNVSYVMGLGEGLAISIDPRRDVDGHLELAQRLDLRITGILETHLHADFVSGARELAAETGAEIFAAAEAAMSFPHRPLSAGERLEFGRASIEVLATPGHTPEHIAFLVSSETSTSLFSGGSLIAGGAARTDLTGAERTEELARAQFASLRLLATLPDETELYPTHGGGSFCSTGPARSAISTIGAERATNSLLAIDDEREFMEGLISSFGTYPRYFSALRERNRKGAPLLRELPVVCELGGTQAHEAVTRGAWLIDGRRVDEWARAHPNGAVSIELRPAFASWLGWVVPFRAPVVLVLGPEQVTEATRLARRIGYDRIEGWLRFGSWREAGLPVSSLEVVSPAEAARRSAQGTVLLDVRQDSEFAAEHIPGAVHLELGDIIAGKTPDATGVITYCGHGERSATAASLLARRGVAVANLEYGMSAWRTQGYPFER